MSILADHSERRASASAPMAHAFRPLRPKNRVWRLYQRVPAPNSTTGRSQARAKARALVSPGASSSVAASAAPIASPGWLGRASATSSRRPSAAKSAHTSDPSSARKRSKVVSAIPGSSAAMIAKLPFHAAPATSAPSEGPCSTTPVKPSRRTEPLRCPPRRSCSRSRPISLSQLNMSPTVTGSGPGFSICHSKIPTGKLLSR